MEKSQEYKRYIIWSLHNLFTGFTNVLKSLCSSLPFKLTFPTINSFWLVFNYIDSWLLAFKKPVGSHIIKSENPTHFVQADLPSFLKICCCKLWTRISYLQIVIFMKTKQYGGWNLLYETPNAKWQKKLQSERSTFCDIFVNCISSGKHKCSTWVDIGN